VAEGFVAGTVEDALGERLRSARRLGGGCIGEVYRVELADGTPLVAKVDREGESHLEREAYMLRYLRERSGLPVPEVYHGSGTVLLMEFVEGDGDLSGAEEHAAELLAALHHVTAHAYGHERDTLIGRLNQSNPWTSSWREFFGEQRLLYAARVALEADRLPPDLYRRVEKLAGRLGPLIGESGGPSLVHGDVWAGNVLVRGERVAAFLDPAIYHADPEVELAYIALFGTFGERFFRRYAEIRPLRDGFFEERRHLYALYPLLVHAYYFGGHYVRRVDDTLRRFGA
jgi:fructosamine-3-kinase